MTPTPLLGRPRHLLAHRLPAHRPAAHRPRAPRHTRLLRLVALSAAALALVALSVAGCDAGTAAPGGPAALPPVSSDQQAIVAEAFEDVESLFALGVDGAARPATAATTPAQRSRMDTAFRSDSTAPRVAPPRVAAPRVAPLPAALASVRAAARASVDTTTYTGVYDAVNTKGYLVQLQYRQPQGVGVWSARVQHARLVAGPGGVSFDAVETVALTFLSYASLDAFVAALGAGTVPYLAGTSLNAEASFAAYDSWRVAQVYSPAEGTAVVSYANANLREALTVRDPVVTLNTNGTGTVRDGGPDGAVRTRYYGANFAVSATGVVSGTLLRTLLSSGDAADGSVLSRSDYPDSSFRQTRQRGGNGVVVRENTQG